MTLKPYYFEVEIKGIALVYANSREEAKKEIDNAGVACAGNKLRRLELEVLGEVKEE
jgi:hypothetical protein